MGGTVDFEDDIFEVIFNKVTVGILAADNETKNILLVNSKLTDMLGYSRKELLSFDIGKIHPKKDIPFVLSQFEKQAKGEIILAENIPVLRKDGQVIYCDISSTPQIFSGKKVLLGIFNEVTKRKEIEERKKKADDTLSVIKKNYKSLAENIPGMSYQALADWSSLIIANSEEITGYPIEEFESEKINWLELIHPNDVDAVIESSSKIEKTSTSIIQEYRIIDKSGNTVWVEDHKTSNVVDGKFQGVTGIVFNISDRKLLEIQKSESENRFRDLVFSTSDWVWEVDKNGRYTYASGAIEEILGYSSEEIIGKTPFDFMPDEEAKRVGELFKKRINEKKPVVDLENINNSKDGKKIILLTNGVPILDNTGKLVGYRGVDKDITEKKKTERELKNRIEELEKFQHLIVDRELKMVELKKRINELEKEKTS